MPTYTLQQRQLKSGDNKGLSIYTILADGQPLFCTDPLTIEKSFPLRDVAADPQKMHAWVTKVMENKP